MPAFATASAGDARSRPHGSRAVRAAAAAVTPRPRPPARIIGVLPAKPATLPATSRLESTATLLRRVRDGDLTARERLCALYLPVLRRWAHGQMPHNARDLVDTHDLVQITLMRVLDRVAQFEPRHEGAFLCYLREALLSSIRDEIRRSVRRGGGKRVELDEALPLPAIAEAVGADTLAEYERALALLEPGEREAVLLRIEFGLSFAEIAEALEKPSADAARMAVKRALVALAGKLA